MKQYVNVQSEAVRNVNYLHCIESDNNILGHCYLYVYVALCIS